MTGLSVRCRSLYITLTFTDACSIWVFNGSCSGEQYRRHIAVEKDACGKKNCINDVILLLMGDWRNSRHTFCATGLSLFVNMLQYERSTPQCTTLHNTTQHGNVRQCYSLHPRTRCLFSFSSSILKLCFSCFFEVVTSMYPTGSQDLYFFFN